MGKRTIKRVTNETPIDKTKAKVPTPKKVVPIKDGKTGANNTAPKKVKPDEVAKKVVTPLKKVVVKREPAKRTSNKETSKVEETKSIPISERIGPAKTKRLSEDKYIRVANDADIEKFKEMSSRIQSGSLQWAFFAVDGDKGYHYYLVLKN